MQNTVSSEAVKSQKAINAEDTLERIIPFSSQVSESVVSTKNGDFLSTWRIGGMNFEGLTDEEILSRMEALNLFIRGLSNGKFAFWVHRVGRYVTDELDIPVYSNFSKDFIEKYYQKLQESMLLQTELYLTVVYRPNPQKKGGFFNRVSRNKEDIIYETNLAIDMLDGIDRQVMSSLALYSPSLLTNYEHNGRIFSEQLEFYGYLINGTWWRIPVKITPLDQYIGVSQVLFGNEIIEIRDTYGTQYGAFVDLKDYPDFSESGILNGLLHLGCEYVETHSFSPLTTLDAQSALRRQRNQMISSEDNAVSQLNLIEVAIDEVASGNFSLGEYHYNLLIKGHSVSDVKRYRSNAIEILNNAGFLGVGMSMVSSLAYAAQLPTNWRFRPRDAKISSRNFVGLCSFHNYYQGKRDNNPWGEAVAILRTPNSAPYYFNFHSTPLNTNSFGVDALGNCQIIGQSGGGKTVLALFLMINLLKYGTQCVFFDKDRGAEIAIRAIGGQYLSLIRGKATGFAPFKMEPTTENILFWGELVRYCALHNNQPLTATEVEDISLATQAVAKLPVELRCFSSLLQALPVAGNDNIAQRLQKWCAGNEFGWVLDCDEDLLAFEKQRPYGFDYTEILDDSDIRAPVMMYLMFRVEKLIDGRRFAFFMDEYWKALSVDYFKNFAEGKQKTIRKQNGFGVFMTQSPSDTLQSDIAKSLIEQTATFVFLPNPRADYDDYVNGFKLTPSEFALVKSLEESSRMFLIKQNNKASIAHLDLNDFRDEIKILSGTTYAVEELDVLRETYGNDPNDWIEHFLNGDSK